ncbi:response regulator [Candidatus Nitrospira bockiana]
MARILIIDDDKMVLDMLRQVLESAAHTVMEAQNGEVALKLWREKPGDLIITDILMPEKDGLEVIRELRREFPAAKVIALSGGSRRIHFDALDVAKRFGAVHTLTKPFELRELLEAVESALSSRL